MTAAHNPRYKVLARAIVWVAEQRGAHCDLEAQFSTDEHGGGTRCSSRVSCGR